MILSRKDTLLQMYRSNGDKRFWTVDRHCIPSLLLLWAEDVRVANEEGKGRTGRQQINCSLKRNDLVDFVRATAWVEIVRFQRYVAFLKRRYEHHHSILPFHDSTFVFLFFFFFFYDHSWNFRRFFLSPR